MPTDLLPPRPDDSPRGDGPGAVVEPEVLVEVDAGRGDPGRPDATLLDLHLPVGLVLQHVANRGDLKA